MHSSQFIKYNNDDLTAIIRQGEIMSHPAVGIFKYLLLTPLLAALLFIIACGGSSPAEQVVVEKEVVKELNKLAGKMKADETLKGFAQPILDIAKSYQSQRKLTLELKTNEAIDIEKAMMAITMAAMGAGTPSEIANHLQIKLESRLD